MKAKKSIACAMAVLLGALPFTACAGVNEPLPPNETEYEEPALSGEPEITPPTEEPSAPVQEATETPQETPPAEPTTAPMQEPEEPEEPEEPKIPAKDYVFVKTSGLNIRSGAGTGYSSLGTVSRGELLSCCGAENGWYETRYLGKTAYVSARETFTSLMPMELASEKTERVIEEGQKLLGVPYVYGAVRFHDGKGKLLKGFTTSRFDCSSLMQYIFYRGANVLLNTTTRTQVSQGKAVAKADIKRGDLLFFTNASRKNNTGIERVGHVALYLGDNYILHTASDYAKIEQISNTRWSYFITARRMF